MKCLISYAVICLALLMSPSLLAQGQSAIFGIGVTSIRGELSNESIADEEYGLNYSLKYVASMKDERFAFTAETSYLNMSLKRQFGEGEYEVNYQSIVSHTYLGVGFRFYMSSSINKYNPYVGQFYPFIGVSAGAVHINRISNRAVIPQQIAGKRPITDPTAGYEFFEGANYEFAAQVEGGFVFVINSIWSVEASGLVRPGFSDSWDGVKGTTNSPDYFMSGGVGVQMRF